MFFPKTDGLLPYEPNIWEKKNAEDAEFNAAWDAAGKGGKSGDIVRPNPPSAKRFFGTFFENLAASADKEIERKEFDWGGHRQKQEDEREARREKRRRENPTVEDVIREINERA